MDTFGPCARCGRPVGLNPFDRWVHIMPGGEWGMRGCRANSFDWSPDKTWDTRLPQHWKARAHPKVRVDVLAINSELQDILKGLAA